MNKLLLIAALFLFGIAPSLQAGTCNWKFYVRNNTDVTIEVIKVSTRTGGLWKTQWTHGLATYGQRIAPGEREMLGDPWREVEFSFDSDTACKPNKVIDFMVEFQCDSGSTAGEKHIRKALNKPRDGTHTVKIPECTDFTS